MYERVAAVLADVRSLSEMLVDVIFQGVLEVVRLLTVRTLKLSVCRSLQGRAVLDLRSVAGRRRSDGILLVWWSERSKGTEWIATATRKRKPGKHRKGMRHLLEAHVHRRCVELHRRARSVTRRVSWLTTLVRLQKTRLRFDDRRGGTVLVGRVGRHAVITLPRIPVWGFGRVPYVVVPRVLRRRSREVLRLVLRRCRRGADLARVSAARSCVLGPDCAHHRRHVRRRQFLTFVLPGVVLLEKLLAHEALVTDATLVLGQQVLRVAPLDVGAEAAEVHEAQRAVLAVVRAVTSVLVDVVFQTVFETIAFRAERTLVLSFDFSTTNYRLIRAAETSKLI